MERLMQYVWQHRLWIQHSLTTVDGRRVQIIDPGRINNGSGPDFFNAKIYIDGNLWVGDVEIHVRASDWHRHGHDSDTAYDSVILHVVDRDDTVIHRSNGEPIPQMQMPCEPQLHQYYRQLIGSADVDIPCSAYIPEVPSMHLHAWIDALAYERIYEKTDHIASILHRFKSDWESTAYITIARALGFGVNGDQFERLALSMPLIFIGKHSDSLTSIEALLFGQSGLLESKDATAEYPQRLQREYQFLAHKFGLSAPQGMIWKTARMRPGNFPHRRIATLAAMLSGGFRMLRRILEVSSLQDAQVLFTPELSDYWRTHYNFSSARPTSIAPFSRSSIAGLTINAIVPLQMAYAQAINDTDMADRAMELLQSLPGEKNLIVEKFQRCGINSPNAFTSQALIQLRRQYCEKHKCLYCRIGHRYLASKSIRPA